MQAKLPSCSLPALIPTPSPPLQAFFRPELLNRMDEVVVFRSLGQPHVRRIADLELAKTAARMAERGIGLEVSSALMATIVEQGWNEAMGARELRRAVTRLVDDALSDAVLRDEVRLCLDCWREVGWGDRLDWTAWFRAWWGAALTSTALSTTLPTPPRLKPLPAACPFPCPQIRAGDVALLDCDSTGRVTVINRSEQNNIVEAAQISYSSVTYSNALA